MCFQVRPGHSGMCECTFLFRLWSINFETLGSFRLYVNVDMWRHVEAPPLRPLATVNRSVDNVKSVGLEFKICTLTIVNAWAERRNVTSCLSSAPSSTGYWRRHRSVDNVKPVAFEFKIWVVNMLSVRWERGSCAVALMLRADITQMERRLHTAQPI